MYDVSEPNVFFQRVEADAALELGFRFVCPTISLPNSDQRSCPHMSWLSISDQMSHNFQSLDDVPALSMRFVTFWIGTDQRLSNRNDHTRFVINL